jgi:hypothetical protein
LNTHDMQITTEHFNTEQYCKTGELVVVQL